MKEFWKNGGLVGETRSPSDKMLMFILRHLLPNGAPGSLAVLNGTIADEARKAFPAALDRLEDSDVPIVPLEQRDFYAAAPDHAQQPPIGPQGDKERCRARRWRDPRDGPRVPAAPAAICPRPCVLRLLPHAVYFRPARVSERAGTSCR